MSAWPSQRVILEQRITIELSQTSINPLSQNILTTLIQK